MYTEAPRFKSCRHLTLSRFFSFF